MGLLEEIEEERKRKEANPPTEESYTKESRTKMYEEIAEKKAEKEEKPEKPEKKEPPSIHNERGEIRMMNQGKYEFNLLDDLEHERIRFELKVPRFMDTSDLGVDLNPLYVRVKVRDKYTQIRFPEEIIVEKSTVQRS